MAVERIYFERIQELEKENKQLKEARDFSVKEGLRLIDENFQLEVELSELKQTLDEIQKYLDAEDVPEHGYPWHIAITKILKEKRLLIGQLDSKINENNRNIMENRNLKKKNFSLDSDLESLQLHYDSMFGIKQDLQQKLEEIKELVKTKMNSTPTSFKESSVKVFAHEIYETLTGKSLSEEIKEILDSQEKE